MEKYFRLKNFIKYQYIAKTKYYLHSPFVYQFYLHVLEGKNEHAYEEIEVMRSRNRANYASVQIVDYGTGNATTRRINDIEKRVAVRTKYGKLLYRLVTYFKPNTILEIGSSIGISASYMALGNAAATIVSLEGAASLIEVAKQNHESLHIQNIQLIEGNFDKTLPQAIANFDTLDLVLFDGNHTKQATLNYFEQCLSKANTNSVFIFDDIYWSEDMYAAWQQIKANKKVTLTIDVFQYGICFFNTERMAKEDFILRY